MYLFLAGLHSSTARCTISHYNSRSRHARVKYSINRLFHSTMAHILSIDIFDLSLLVLEIIQVQDPSGFTFLDSYLYNQRL